ncbi:MAG TPA: nucleotidyltransferase family protein, partial [Pyrinomonadaceae bacterium]|nr:nucleotidyltransferase family protein [Pyrinomonadaceae bacterium]
MSLEKKEKEDEKRWLILRTKVYEEKIKAAFDLFRANGIEPILIKGWAVGREYPEKFRRTYSDIDLCVVPADYEKSLKIIAAGEGLALNVDLHCGLRHLDTVEWDALFENSFTVPLGEVEVRILRPEDHLRVLCVHWLNDGGAYKERLLDIFYLLENHSNDFDWERCFGKISQNRREWIIKTIAVVHKYHKLDV